MMKRIVILLLLLPFYECVLGQEFKLLSVEERSIDSLLSTNDRYDLNGNLSAVVVISFQEPIDNLSFRGNIIEKMVQDEHTYILYVAHITKRITIQHENYYPFVLDFRDNDIKIEGGHSYMVVIDNKIIHVDTETTGNQDTGSQYLVFKSETKLKRIVVDGEEWDINNYNTALKMVPFGTYHYEAQSADGKIINGDVKVKNKISSKVVNLFF